MKKFLILGAFAVLAQTPAGIPKINIPPVPPPVLSTSMVTVLADSLATNPTTAESYPTLLQQKITAAGLPYTINNQGKGGRQTSEGLLYFDALVTTNTKVLVLELGGGDGRNGVPIATIRANLATMIQKAQAKNIPVLLLGIWLADPASPTATQYQKDFAAMWPSLAAQFSIPYVPNIYASLTTSDVQPPPPNGDSYHPVASGAVKIANTVWPLLQPLLGVTPPPSTSTTANGYFNALIGRVDKFKAYSLRDTVQLQQYSAGQPPNYQYFFTYSAAQDAAQVVVPTVAAGQIVPTGVNSIHNHLKLPIGTMAGHTYLFTWDARFASSFAFAQTGVSYFKTFQFTARRSPIEKDTIWLETCNQFDAFQAGVGMARARYYPTTYTPSKFPPPYDGSDTRYKDGLTSLYGPYTNFNVPIYPNVWTRYWWLIEQNANDFERASLWVADENHDAVQILDRVQVETPNGIEHFWLEFNTSTEGIYDRGTKAMILPGGIATATVREAMVAHVRNVVVLQDPASMSGLLQRPVK